MEDKEAESKELYSERRKEPDANNNAGPGPLPYTRYWSLGGRLRIKNETARQCIAEVIGTFILTFFAVGSGAKVLLSGGEAGSAFTASLGCAVGVSMAIYCSITTSGGHVNPIISLLFFLRGELLWWRLPLYLLSQHVGAFAGAALVYGLYKDAMADTDLSHLALSEIPGTALLWASYPQSFVTKSTAFLSHATASGFLVFCVAFISDPHNNPVPTQVIPILVGLLVLGMGNVFGYNVGPVSNPAVDLSCRAFSTLTLKGPFSFLDSQWFLLPTLVPYVGAVLGLTLYMLTLSIHLPTAYRKAPPRDSNSL